MHNQNSITIGDTTIHQPTNGLMWTELCDQKSMLYYPKLQLTYKGAVVAVISRIIPPALKNISYACWVFKPARGEQQYPMPLERRLCESINQAEWYANNHPNSLYLEMLSASENGLVQS